MKYDSFFGIPMIRSGDDADRGNRERCGAEQSAREPEEFSETVRECEDRGLRFVRGSQFHVGRPVPPPETAKKRECGALADGLRVSARCRRAHCARRRQDEAM